MIDSQLLDAYVAELEALRVHGRDLAHAYPDIAGRLDIGPRRSRDAHVERVVESAAFLAARLRMMIESAATELPLATLNMLAPSLVEPVPSMVLLEFRGGNEVQPITKGMRFDYVIGGQALICFSATMATTLAPISLELRRLNPNSASPDGIGIKVIGEPPPKLLLCLGNDDLTAAVLVDAVSDRLATIEVLPPSGGAPRQARSANLRICGFSSDEAALPVQPAAHKASRIATEFMVFPEKFRFIELSGLPLQSGSEILLRFTRRLALSPRLPVDLISTNKVPAINLWKAPATPFDIDGRKLEFPVRVDALRYRTIECHSVETVDLYTENSNKPMRIDPIVSFGNIQGSDVRWGLRRIDSRVGAEVLMYFQGLDYRNLGYQRYLTAPRVFASNRDLAQRAVVGAVLQSVEGGMGGWQASLSTAPTRYHTGISGSHAMMNLVGYMHSSMNSFSESGGASLLRDYLKHFPGAQQANWIKGIQSVALRSIAVTRRGKAQSGLALILTFDTQRYKTTSHAIVKRVLGELFESQRGLNRVDEIVVRG